MPDNKLSIVQTKLIFREGLCQIRGEMLPMNAVDCVVLLVMTTVWWVTCQGYIVVDVEADGDDIWPVLCPPSTFYSKKQDQCLTCSQCPANKIIVTECHGLHDTRCGPFYSFEDLNSPEASLPVNETLNNHESKDQVSHIHLNPKHGVSHQDSSKSPFEFTDSEWKFVTICLFVFLSLAAIVIFMVVVYLCRQKDTKEKKFVCEFRSPVDDV